MRALVRAVVRALAVRLRAAARVNETRAPVAEAVRAAVVAAAVVVQRQVPGAAVWAVRNARVMSARLWVQVAAQVTSPRCHSRAARPSTFDGDGVAGPDKGTSGCQR